MGWFSATIMGGDSPLDCLGNIADSMEIEINQDEEGKDDFHCYPFTKEKIENNTVEAVKAIAKTKLELYYNISYQVLGVVIMRYGATFPAKLRKKIIEEAWKDEWYLGDKKGERGTYIKDFVKTIENYKDGERKEVAEEGIFEKLAQKVSEEVPKVKKPRNLCNNRYNLEAYESGGYKHVEVNICKHDRELTSKQMRTIGNWLTQAADWKNVKS